MGAFLDKPKTDKEIVKGEGCGIRYGVSAMQGWRVEMEDAHVCETSVKKLKDCCFFGVFDGHAGPKVAQYCSVHLLETILEQYEEKKNDKKNDEKEKDKISSSIHDGFLVLDEKLKKINPWKDGEDRSGSTAVVVMLTPNEIIWGNCGDSRGLLCRNDKVHFVTTDHKPHNDLERSRIEKAGGTVMMQRVNGSLAVSRALGDFDYKRSQDMKPIEQLVSPEPEMMILDRDHEQDQFFLLACDGIFDVMTNEAVVEFILHQLTLKDDLGEICSSLIDTCLNKNSRDNMSVVLVTFPSAPKVSQEAIDRNATLQEEAKKAIEARIEKMVSEATDPLDIEENSVMEQLSTEFPKEYEVYSKRKMISELLATARKERFGNEDDSGDDFTGPSDSSEAPSSFDHFSGPVLSSEERSSGYTTENVRIVSNLDQPSLDSDKATMEKNDSTADN